MPLCEVVEVGTGETVGGGGAPQARRRRRQVLVEGHDRLLERLEVAGLEPRGVVGVVVGEAGRGDAGEALLFGVGHLALGLIERRARAGHRGVEPRSSCSSASRSAARACSSAAAAPSRASRAPARAAASALSSASSAGTPLARSATRARASW